jgi:hypothetical protein
MIHIQTLAIKKTLLFLSILIFFGCSVNKNTSTAFKDTYIEILKGWDGRYMKVPTFEQSEKGIKFEQQRRPDTLSPLKKYIQKEHITVNFDRLNKKMSEMPLGFVYQFKDSTIDYIPKNVVRFSNKIYEFIPFNHLDDVFKTKIPSQSDFGGVLQFSKLLLNKKCDKALLFIRNTRHSLNSTESLYLLEKKNGRWGKVQSFGISMS